VTENQDGEGRGTDSSGWKDWQRWTEGVDWSDWRSWLQRLATTDWAATDWTSTDWTGTDQAATGRTPVDWTREQALGAPWEQAPIGGEIPLTLRAFAEDEPADRIREHLAASWPPFRQWWRGGANTRPTTAEARAKTAYTGRRVLGMLDCLWGLLDGVNDAGLAVSLTFGGRPQVGEGFGIPLVIRYVLEVCETVEEAVRVLSRVPVHMSYNVTAIDRDGRRATVYLAPDRPARVTGLAVATNHQGEVEWAPYVAAIRSVERQNYLEELLAAGTGASGVVAACLRSPLYATRFYEGFGTLFTAEYRPADGLVRYHWPDRTWEHSLDKIDPAGVQVQLGTPSADTTAR